MKKKIFIIAAVAVVAVTVATTIIVKNLSNKPTVKNNTNNNSSPTTDNAQNMDTQKDENLNPYFDATVDEVSKSSIVLTPLKGQTAVTGYNKLEIPTVLQNGEAIAQLQKGNVVRVIFNGQIAKSSPGKINTVFRVYLLDNSGNPII